MAAARRLAGVLVRSAAGGRDEAADAQPLEEHVVRFGIVPGIGQKRLERHAGAGLKDHAVELQVVGPWSAVDDGGQEQVAAGIEDGREFRITVFEVAVMALAASGVVGRAVP
jgi:hypothetical protein